MKLIIVMETTEEELIRCICAAWENRNNEPLDPDKIKPFSKGDILNKADAENMMIGSSLGQLAENSDVEMRIE